MAKRVEKLKLENILALDAEREKSSFFDELQTETANIALENSFEVDFTRINQVKPKPQTNYAVPWNEINKEKKVRAISDYFKKNPFAHLKNFPKAKKIFLDLFENVEDINKDIEFLKEELDKNTSSRDQYGKVIINVSFDEFNPAAFKIQIFRPMMEEIKQFFIFDLSKAANSPERLQVHTQNDKSKKIILLRSLHETKSRPRIPLKSIQFDAEIWKGFIGSKIVSDSYNKVLDCLERNHVVFEEFVKRVNSREAKYLQFLAKDLIRNISIRTNSKDTSFINFKTEQGQSVEFKINKLAVSLQLC
ncbi:MAG: hypothetical protein MK033_03660 [Candidatus Caenarcaniphilales bacterium]|nr:hypothetical protein [Candidatus Caenarcaniphilales bacterium]